jgi:hypothetical protein
LTIQKKTRKRKKKKIKGKETSTKEIKKIEKIKGKETATKESAWTCAVLSVRGTLHLVRTGKAN